MKVRTLVFTAAAVFAGLLLISGSVNAAKGGTQGPPNNGGGGTPPPPPVDFGDLIKLYRNANGVPILTAADVAGPNTGLCQQPLYFASDECPTACEVVLSPDVSVVKVDQATCAVSATPDNCAPCTQEVDFGRINVARASDTVFDEQLQDVVFNLSTSDCAISLDPAGRMVTGTVTLWSLNQIPIEWTTSAIDSPLQNLAIYRQLIQSGSIGAPLPAGALITAARGLGAASDKAGGVDMDLVAYINETMGLTATTTILDPKICIQVREEAQGTVQLVQKCFLDYSAFSYARTLNFGSLPSPKYIPEGAAADGTFEYLAVLNSAPTFGIEQGPILNAVFGDGSGGYLNGFTDGNIGGFAQAADDTRAVIDYMHSWPVPTDYATPVPCAARTDITYDVSIPEQSGLQVPKNIVSGSEGREFIVTVANAGPDLASGTVTVSADVADGSVVLGAPWTYTFTNLVAGQSVAFTQIFTAPTVSQATAITWTADIDAQYDPDNGPLGANNTATATSNVRLTSGRP